MKTMNAMRSVVRVFLILNAIIGVGYFVLGLVAERIGWIVAGPFGEAQVMRILEFGTDPGLTGGQGNFSATFAFIGAILLGISARTGSKWYFLFGAALLAALRFVYGGEEAGRDFGWSALHDWTYVFLAMLCGFVVGRCTLPIRSRRPVTVS